MPPNGIVNTFNTILKRRSCDAYTFSTLRLYPLSSLQTPASCGSEQDGVHLALTPIITVGHIITFPGWRSLWPRVILGRAVKNYGAKYQEQR